MKLRNKGHHKIYTLAEEWKKSQLKTKTRTKKKNEDQNKNKEQACMYYESNKIEH